MDKIVIFGSGNHAKLICVEVLKFKKLKFLGFIDNSKKKNKLILKIKNKKYYNLGSINQVVKKKNNFKGIIGVGLNFLRKNIYYQITSIDKKFKFQTLISQNSIINSNVTIGEGTVILSGVVINPFTEIKDHCIINTKCSIDHNNFFNNFSSTGPGVITGGSVNVGIQSHLGIGSVIKNNIKIGNNTVIGAKSFINKNCKSNYLYFGSPARKVKIINSNFNYL